MSLAVLFWILMLLWLVFSVWSTVPEIRSNWRPAGGSLLLFLVVLVLGWAQYGAPIQGS